MLCSLHVRHLVTIEELSLDLDAGMSALTGETGAGKSILIDSLGLVLGDKADSSLVRQGHDKAEVSATFDLCDSGEAADLLRELDLLEEHGECVVRRVLTSNGRSRAFINSTPVNLSTLAQLGEKLVDIHGQNAHQSLMKTASQRALLDAYAGNEQLLQEMQHCWRQWHEATRELDRLQQQEQDRHSRHELLQFQLDEIEQLALQEQEWSALEAEQRRLSNAGELRARNDELLGILYADDGVAHQLHRSVAILRKLHELDSLPADNLEMLQSALIEVEESSHALHQYADNIQLDPARLASVEQRISDILQLARKHHVEPEELPRRHDDLQQQLEALLESDAHTALLQQQIEACRQQWLQLAGSLSKQRQKAAASLSSRVTATMRGLSMPDGRFSVKLRALEQAQPSATGQESVEFYFSANRGQAQQPLNKAASGGELSRISLAIQVSTLGLAQLPTLIFDEVDAGIGGGVAEVVGQLLRQLGERQQILCVTHLPQVAAQAHNHLRVEKQRSHNSTRTLITTLAEHQRVDEIARMLGGIKISKGALEHAAEMLSSRSASAAGKSADCC
jgi:DNA repair protein RecN (Recombination protein N)